MDWIDIIITFVLLGVGLIGNIRKKSVSSSPSTPDVSAEFEQDEPAPSVSDLMEEIRNMMQTTEAVSGSSGEPVPVVEADVVPEVPRQKVEEQVVNTTTPPPVTPEEWPEASERRWSDEELKKLILYSEIMKPKFTES